MSYCCQSLNRWSCASETEEPLNCCVCLFWTHFKYLEGDSTEAFWDIFSLNARECYLFRLLTGFFAIGLKKIHVAFRWIAAWLSSFLSLNFIKTNSSCLVPLLKHYRGTFSCKLFGKVQQKIFTSRWLSQRNTNAVSKLRKTCRHAARRYQNWFPFVKVLLCLSVFSFCFFFFCFFKRGKWKDIPKKVFGMTNSARWHQCNVMTLWLGVFSLTSYSLDPKLVLSASRTGVWALRERDV